MFAWCDRSLRHQGSSRFGRSGISGQACIRMVNFFESRRYIAGSCRISDLFEKIVVDATFSSVKHLAWETKFRYLGPLAPAAWNLSRLWYFVYVGQDIENIGPEYDISNLQNIPVFLIHGSNDPIIPFAESKRLHAAAVVGTELWIVEGAGHSASFLNIDYSQKVDEFFSQ